MKKILVLVVMMTFASVAFAQASDSRKMKSLANRNSSSAQADGIVHLSGVPVSTPGMPQKIGTAASTSGQPINPATGQPAGTSFGSGAANSGRKVCRTIGSTVYYCL